MNKRTKMPVSLMLSAAILFSTVGTATAIETSETPEQTTMTAAEGVCPTQQEAYDRMNALKATYPEGLYWTNFAPYGRDGDKGAFYRWKGGKLENNVNGGVGCAAFAFILSDAAFGDLPGRMVYGSTYDDIKVGDILRVNNNSHFVIVLQKSAGGVVVAEGNYNKSVHWGRAISKADVEKSSFIVTRYPVGIDPDGGAANDEVVKNGIEGGLNWTLTQGGTLTISGNGTMQNFSGDNLPSWMAENFYTIVVEDGVTSIGNYAFYQSNALGVYLPDGITKIGDSAFRASKILSVTVPNTVTTIGDDAFRECGSLTSVSISEGLTTIGERAFHSCTNLQYIDFPASVTEVKAGAFTSCSKMARARFAPGTEMVNVGDDLFTQCWALSDLTLPLKINRISNRMFQSCSSLTSIYIPADVADIGENPFTSTPMQYGGTISFGGDEATWKNIGGQFILNAMPNANIVYNVPFDNPFAKDPNDPGDLVPEDSDHEHNWSTNWNHDTTHHWHDCNATGCTVTETSKKDGYAGHSYGDWVTDKEATASEAGSRYRVCTVCGYRQTGSIPATGGASNPGSSGSSGNSGSSGSSSSSGSSESSSNAPVTTTTRNPDGSTTTTVTNNRTGTTTETARKPDGSSVVTTTLKDGSKAVVTTLQNGIVAAVDTDAAGGVTMEIKLPTAVIDPAEQRGEPIPLPIPETQVVSDVAAAAPITVRTEKAETAKVAIPVASPTDGTVAVIMKPDGTTEVVKTSVLKDNNIVLALENNTTVKIIENSKVFKDVPSGAWYENATAFTSARKLFSGTSPDTFAPNEPMTRAMLMTVLARFDGAETDGGETWYEKGVEWAAQQGISNGANPDGNITREQVVTMLWRYMGSPAVTENLSGCTDADQISEYAQEAMRWAVKNGILRGFGDGRLGPQDQASRAQVSQILMNLIKNITLYHI